MTSRSRRRSFRWLRVSIALVLIAAVNAGAWWVWQDKAPWLTLFPEPSSSQVREEAVSVPVTQMLPSDRVSGQDVATRLLGAFPYSGVEWRPGPVSNTPVGLPSDISCDPVRITPSIQSNRDWRYRPSDSTDSNGQQESVLAGNAGALGGLMAQVRIYPAGLGAVAMQRIRDQVSACVGDESWRANSGWDMSLGREAFTFSAVGDGADVDIVVFRVGDIVGVVAGRGPTDVAGLAGAWERRWLPIIGESCANPDSGAFDATRQPLHSTYRGYTTSKTLELTPAQKATIEAQVAENVRLEFAATSSTEASGLLPTDPDGSLGVPPATRAGEPGEELEINDIPTTMLAGVQIPGRPALPVFPRFPREPKTTGSISGPTLDEVGPGCGWSLTGQQVPVIDEEAAEQAWAQARADEEDRLSRGYASYIKATWKYASAYQDYARQVAEWNAWTQESQRLIVIAEWQAYDRAVDEYVEAEERYIIDLAAWSACVDQQSVPGPGTTPSPAPVPSLSPESGPVDPDSSAGPSAAPSPEPSPSVSSTPVTPSTTTAATAAVLVRNPNICGVEPTPPSRPVAPEYPRPAEVPAPIPFPTSSPTVTPPIG